MKTYEITFKDDGGLAIVECGSFRIDYGFVHLYDEFGECFAAYNSGTVASIVEQKQFASAQAILLSLVK